MDLLRAHGAKRGVEVKAGLTLDLGRVFRGEPFSRLAGLGEVLLEPGALIEVVACL